MKLLRCCYTDSWGCSYQYLYTISRPETKLRILPPFQGISFSLHNKKISRVGFSLRFFKIFSYHLRTLKLQIQSYKFTFILYFKSTPENASSIILQIEKKSNKSIKILKSWIQGEWVKCRGLSKKFSIHNKFIPVWRPNIHIDYQIWKDTRNSTSLCYLRNYLICHKHIESKIRVVMPYVNS